MNFEYLKTILFTKENLTFALSVIGSVGTAINFFRSRKNLKLKLQYFGSSSDKQISLAYIQFENKSVSPILITDVCIIIGNVAYPCQKLPTVVQTTSRKIGKENFYHDIYNLSFPIQIGGIGGTSGYLLFDIPGFELEVLQFPIILQVVTNRGQSKKYRLYPDREYL